MKKILVIGFGAMGCRHVQSLMEAGAYELHVVEPSEETRLGNAARTGVDVADIRWYERIGQVGDGFAMAIVATSSAPRFDIMQSLLKKGIERFLVEKIVFQSETQFEIIGAMLAKKNAKAYCNFTSRYFDAYNRLRDHEAIRKGRFSMTVHGGAFGLGCNAIHYVDIFQYLSGSDNVVVVDEAQLDVFSAENRRGNEYKELTGIINLKNERSDHLMIISDEQYNGGVTISINAGNQQFLLSEATGKIYSNEPGAATEAYEILPTSRLTARITAEILSGYCRLTQISETRVAHATLFDAFNKTFFGIAEQAKLCPVT